MRVNWRGVRGGLYGGRGSGMGWGIGDGDWDWKLGLEILHTIAAVITNGAGWGRLAGGEETLGAPGPGRGDVGHVFWIGAVGVVQTAKFGSWVVLVGSSDPGLEVS